MVRQKKNSLSNKSLKNMYPSQFNNPRRNGNNLDGRTPDIDSQNLCKVFHGITQNSVNMNKQDQNMMPNQVTQSTANFNSQNSQTNNVIPNAVTQLPQWHSQITMSDILNDFVNGQNSNNSLFTSGLDLYPQSNFQPTFGFNQINSNNGIHSLLKQSNFPLINEQDLSDNGPRDNASSQYSNAVSVGRPYDKVMKTSNSNTSEFIMYNEDFPALPGTQMQMHNVANTPSTMINSNQQWSKPKFGSKLLNKLNMDQFIDHNSIRNNLNTDFHMNGNTVPNPGIQTSLDKGKVTNIPSSMLRDQFGIVGQLVTMRTAERDPNLVELAFGHDLTSLGMNLNSPENIYPTFGGPFENYPLEPHNIEFDVPSEYKIHHKIKNKLAPIKLSEYKEDLLFYLFYTHLGDAIQVAVANELRTRGWRYHTGQHIWVTPVSNMSEVDCKFECGTYYVFDVTSWRKVPRELMLDPTLFDGCDGNDSFKEPDTK